MRWSWLVLSFRTFSPRLFNWPPHSEHREQLSPPSALMVFASLARATSCNIRARALAQRPSTALSISVKLALGCRSRHSFISNITPSATRLQLRSTPSSHIAPLPLLASSVSSTIPHSLHPFHPSYHLPRKSDGHPGRGGRMESAAVVQARGAVDLAIIGVMADGGLRR